MRTICKNVYSFDELSEDAKRKAIEKCYDINVCFDWWESTYEDAKNIGLQIASFDLDRNRHANGHFLESGTECAFRILAEHGETCDTYKTASNFIADWNKLVEKYSDGIHTDKVTEENEYDFDNEADELELQFLKNILEDYSIILQNESEYLMSEEAIIETIEANQFEFYEDGKLA